MRVPAVLLALALASAPDLGLAQSLSDARSFALGLFLAYQRGQPEYLGRDGPHVFSPRLLALIRRDQRLTPRGDAPALDGDPICDCQDAAGLGHVRVKATEGAPGRARARVQFELDGDRREVSLDLVALGGRWLVDDVHTRETPSLVRFLQDAHPRSRGWR